MAHEGRLSKALFGNANLLPVAREAARLSPSSFTVREIGSETGIPDPVVAPIIRRLKTAGVVRENRAKGRSRRYRIVDGPFWELVRSLP